jgi:topoisomerase-4 subunit B
MCTGIHQKIINEYINAKLEDSLGHHFYDCFVSLNLPPKVVKFGDQNKTRFVSPREDVFGYIDMEIGKRIVSFFRTQIFLSIQKKVDERRNEGEYKKLRAQRKKIDVKFSHKYFPSASRKPETLFIVVGLSASGSILQKRQPQKEAVYALKGKIKNARSLGDLSSNKEILELMQILNLDPENSKLECPFQKIVIATDSDFDGYHIRSLLINLFNSWFPWLVEQGKIYILETPIVTVGDRSKKYFYTMEDFLSYKGQKTHVRYLKGLGSLAISDWEHVMADKSLNRIQKDPQTNKNLEMAFGKLSSLRKDWLSAKS